MPPRLPSDLLHEPPSPPLAFSEFPACPRGPACTPAAFPRLPRTWPTRLASPQACHTPQQVQMPHGPRLGPPGQPRCAGPAPLCLTAVRTGRPLPSGWPLLWALPSVSGSFLLLSSELPRPAWQPSGWHGRPCPRSWGCSCLVPSSAPSHTVWDSRAILAKRFLRVPCVPPKVGWGLHPPLPCPERLSPQGCHSCLC